MVNNKKQKIKKIKKEPEYRTKQQRQNEVKILISKINELHLTTEYKAIQEFYNLMFKYINDGERIIINIPFPEIKKTIEGVLAINIKEEVAVRLKA